MVSFITGNKRKLEALKIILEDYKVEFDSLKLELPEIQSHDGKEIAFEKAKQAFSQLQRACFVEDTEWRIPALKGFPGMYMKYVNEWFTPKNWINLMKGESDRRVVCINHYGCANKMGEIEVISVETEFEICEDLTQGEQHSSIWKTGIDYILKSNIVGKRIIEFDDRVDRKAVFSNNIQTKLLAEYIKLNS